MGQQIVSHLLLLTVSMGSDILGTMKFPLSDPVLIALIGGVATVLAAVVPILINRSKRSRAKKRAKRGERVGGDFIR